MEIKPREIIYNIDLVKRLRITLLFLVRVPLPILGILLIIRFAFLKFFLDTNINLFTLFIPFGVVIGTAALFAPFLFYVLIKEKRRAWLITFLVIVILPFLFVFLIIYYSISSVPWIIDPSIIYLMIPFYIYCYLLKRTVDEWLSEYEAHELRIEQKREKARRLKDEEGWM